MALFAASSLAASIRVGDAFGLRQIELVVEKCAPGEFARFREARAQRQTALEQALHHGVAAMPLQLKHVFAGKGMRRREKQGDALIDD